MRFKREREEEGGINLTPLIDVVFLLLIFFMVTTTFISAPGIKLNLPKASSQDIIREKKDFTIVLGLDNKLLLNQKEVNVEELRVELAKAAQVDPNLLVIIRADEEISHGRVVEIMDIARTAGLVKLAIATKPKG